MGVPFLTVDYWKSTWDKYLPETKTNVTEKNPYISDIQKSGIYGAYTTDVGPKVPLPGKPFDPFSPTIKSPFDPGQSLDFLEEGLAQGFSLAGDESPDEASIDSSLIVPSLDSSIAIGTVKVHESIAPDVFGPEQTAEVIPLIAEKSPDPGCGPVVKIRLPFTSGQTEYKSEREIRPHYTVGRIKEEKKFIFDLVDSSGESHAIRLSDCSIISGFALTPAPESLTINSAKVINRYHTMSRWVEEHWGDTLDTITFSGGSYGLFQLKSGNGGMGEGLTEVNRRESEAYKMLKEVANIYRSNGMLYQDNKTYDESAITTAFLRDQANSYFTSNHPRRGLPKERLYVKLFYDYMTCLGYIESFDIMEDASTPFRIKYSISFKAEKTIFHQGNSAQVEIGTPRQLEPLDLTPNPLLKAVDTVPTKPSNGGFDSAIV